jgi:nucleoside-diphosphate-sugar epimerase
VIDEYVTCFPKNEYERTKLESERLLKEAAKEYQFELVILRPTNVFGEYHPYNALLNMTQHIGSGKPVLLTPGALVNYVYVKDLVATILAFVSDVPVQGTFNVGEAMTLNEFSTIISEALQQKKKQISIPAFLINFMNMIGFRKFTTVSNRVAYEDMALKKHFHYPFGIKNGLERTINHYKEKGLLK